MVAVPSIGRASQVTPRRSAPEADATRDLYERYARQIYTYCLHQLGNREEAEDAVQSTFLNAFRGYQRGVDPEFESAWIYKIAQNVCLTRQRSSSRRRRVETASDLDAMQDYVPAHEIDADELIHLPEALDAMPHQQRKALLLREWQGLSYKEIAEELDLSQAAVETLLFRARRALAAGLNEEPAKKSTLRRLRSGGDAGSVLALLKSLLFTGGAKVATAVATVAATSVVAATPAARHVVEDVVTPGHDRAPAPAHQVARTPGSGGAPASSRVAVSAPVVSVARSTPARSSAEVKHVPPVRTVSTLRPHASRASAPVVPVVHSPAPVEPAAVAPAAPVAPVTPAVVDAPAAPQPEPVAAQPPPVQPDKPKGDDKKNDAAQQQPAPAATQPPAKSDDTKKHDAQQSQAAPAATQPQAPAPGPAAKGGDGGTTKKNDAAGAPSAADGSRVTSSSVPSAPVPAPAADQSAKGKDNGDHGNGNGNGNGKKQADAVPPSVVPTPALVTATATATTTSAAPPPPPVTTTAVTTTTAAPAPAAPPQPAVTTPQPAPSDNGNGNGRDRGNGNGHRK